MESGMAPSAFPRTSRAKGSPSTACTRGNIIWRPTCCSSYLRAAHYYPWCRVSCLARFFPDSNHYLDGYYGADGPLPASAGPTDSHSPWDSAAPRSFATSSTCSGAFLSSSRGPLLSTRGAYYLIIRSLLSLFCIYILCFWMSYVFWTTFILGLDIFHVCLVYCTLSVYIDIFLFVYFSYSFLFPLIITFMIFLFLCNMWFLLSIQSTLLSGGITSSLLLPFSFRTLRTMFILVRGRVEEVIYWIFLVKLFC